MQARTKNILGWSGLVALGCVVAWIVYKYVHAPKHTTILPQKPLPVSFGAVFSDQNGDWLKYLTPGHSLDISSRSYGSSQEVYPLMNLTDDNFSRVDAKDMTASEILLCACFNNFPKEAPLDAASSPLSQPTSGNPPTSAIPPPGYTLNEHMGRICHRLSYLALFYELMHRYDLYIEIMFDGNGGFGIRNKVNPANETTPEKDRDAAWALQQARYKEVNYAIGMMNYCNVSISSDLRTGYYKDITQPSKDINSNIERLNELTLAAHNAYRIHIRPPLSCQPMPSSLMRVNDEMLQQVQNARYDKIQPSIDWGPKHSLYDTNNVLRDFVKGERKALEEDLLASQSTHSKPNKDVPSGQIGKGSSTSAEEASSAR